MREMLRAIFLFLFLLTFLCSSAFGQGPPDKKGWGIGEARE